MQKTSILDFVTRLSELTGKPKTQPEQSPENNQVLTHLQDNKDNDNPQKNLTDNKNNSFMKTYNPFGEVQKGKSQLSMQKAPKPTKNKIDLSSSKNLTKTAQSDGTKNMIDLINRHNAFLAKIKRS